MSHSEYTLFYTALGVVTIAPHVPRWAGLTATYAFIAAAGYHILARIL